MKTYNSLSKIEEFKYSRIEELIGANASKKDFYEIKVKDNSVVIDKEPKTALHEFYLKDDRWWMKKGNLAVNFKLNENPILSPNIFYPVAEETPRIIHRFETSHFILYAIYLYRLDEEENVVYIQTNIKVREKNTMLLVLTKENKTNVKVEKDLMLNKPFTGEELFEIFKENYL